MAIVRGHHAFDQQFTQIPNAWLRDPNLSFKAIGLLAQIMSHSRGWSMSISSLAEKNREGKDAIRSAVKELEDNGYLIRKQENQGRFGEAIWITCDPAENPMAENPTTENPTPKNNNIKNNNLKNNQRTYVQDFEKFWVAYPNKRGKQAAEKAFIKALNLVTAETLIAGATQYANDPNLPEPKFVKHPATWLNAGCWDDPPLPADPKRLKQLEQQRNETELMEYLANEQD